jgi:hypothetical protein
MYLRRNIDKIMADNLRNFRFVICEDFCEDQDISCDMQQISDLSMDGVSTTTRNKTNDDNNEHDKMDATKDERRDKQREYLLKLLMFISNKKSS